MMIIVEDEMIKWLEGEKEKQERKKDEESYTAI